MNPFGVDPSWYETYWYGPRSRSKPRRFRWSVLRAVIVVALVSAGGMLVGHLTP